MNLRSMVAVLLAWAIPCFGAQPDDFRFSREIKQPDASKENILAVTLDSDLYTAVRADLSDLRIFDSKGQEVPFLLEKTVESRTQIVQKLCEYKIVSFHEKDNTIEIIVVLDKKATSVDGLTVHTSLVNFERRLQVWGSNSDKDWSLLTDKGFVFDYSQFMDIKNKEVHLPKNSWRWLKIIISAISESRESPYTELSRKLKNGVEQERFEKTLLERRPLHIDRLELWHEKPVEIARQDQKTDYPIADFSVTEDSQKKTTLVTVQTHREPLTQLKIETTSRNFHRAAEVERVSLARDAIELIDLGGIHHEKLAITFPEHRAESYHLVIYNEDSPPLAITGVKARGNVYRAVFLAAANESYRVGFGSDLKQVEPPKYDVAAVQAALRGNIHPTPATLGPVVAHPNASQFKGLPLWANPFLLGGLAVVLVVLLGLALFHAARRIGQIPE